MKRVITCYRCMAHEVWDVHAGWEARPGHAVIRSVKPCTCVAETAEKEAMPNACEICGQPCKRLAKMCLGCASKKNNKAYLARVADGPPSRWTKCAACGERVNTRKPEGEDAYHRACNPETRPRAA